MENLFCDFVEIIKSFDNLHIHFETKLYCRQQCQSKVSDFVDLLAGIVTQHCFLVTGFFKETHFTNNLTGVLIFELNESA